MRRVFIALFAALLAAAVLSPPASAEDQHSDNIKRLAQAPIIVTQDDPKTEENERIVAQGSDIAFEKNLLIAGSWQGVGFFKISPRAPYIQQISFIICNGAQGDVSVYGDLVFMSVDTPQVKSDGTAGDGSCDSINASGAQIASGAAWEGVRVFSIANPKQPKFLGAMQAGCGSHTHTLLPSGSKLYLYMHSYPLVSGQGPTCNYAVHRKNFIFEVNTADPSKSEIVGELNVTPAPGCHDATFDPARKLAFAACLTESQVWDISDPTAPEIISRIRNPFVVHHSSALTWDGKIAVIGDEFAGAAAGAGCAPGSSDSPIGAMWFYDITDPAAPVNVGHFGPPRTAFPNSAEEASRHACTNHNFTVLPMKDPKKYIVSTSWYAAGISLIDFSDPGNAEEIAYYVPEYEGQQPDTWAAYYYNGFIYTNDVNLPRGSASLPGTPSAGVGVYQVKGYDAKTTYFHRTRLNPQVQIQDFK
ncbi:MAG: hypothetical protein M3277_02625 [Actinomycetota bacterium]|nr:hypothetical protein [Actinomycetota bacterium]